jgi:ATP-binding cassette subfamily C protein
MNLYKRLFGDITGYLRWRFPALLALMVVVGLTEGLSVTLLLPLFSHAGISFAAGRGAAGALLNQALTVIGSTVGPVGILVIVVAVAAFQLVLSALQQWWMTTACRGYQRYQQAKLFRAFMRAQWEFAIERKAGELTNAIVGETTRLAEAFYIGLHIVATLIGTGIYLVFALIIAWQVTAALIVCAALMTLSVVGLYRKSFAVGRTIAPLSAELQAVLGERISGIKIVKATGSENASAALVDGIAGQLEWANTLVDFFPALVRGLFEFFSFVVLAAIFVFGGVVFGLAPGNIIVVFALFVRLFPRITALQGYLHLLNSYVHALGVIDSLERAARARAEDDSERRIAIALPACLEMRGVVAKFGARRVLDRVDLVVPVPGLMGIVGASGAGKSTLVHTILGLVQTAGGAITFGGHTLSSSGVHAWRRQMGYVPQETILFHAPVWDNLSLAKPEASAAEIELAAKRAHAHNFIAALPRGYQTIIGDQGVALSGGQRQRLGIARALLGDPKLLLMDEALNALDAESEAELLRTIEELRRQVGVLIIAHRLATVRAADCICVLDAGRVVEAGTWDELMARRARLFALVETQSSADRRNPVMQRP